MTEKLETCPFCGGEARISDLGTLVICMRCDARVPLGGIEERNAAKRGVKHKPSLEAWNRRAERAGWIKTSERLPEAHRNVLVWNKHKYAAVAYVDFSCPVWHTTGNVWEIDEFPYWMPLPEPPEEE